MSMDRRGFLNLLGLTPVAVVADKASWWKWLKNRFRPEPDYVFEDWEAREALAFLQNQLVMTGTVNRDYEAEFARDFAIGEPIRVKFPMTFTVDNGHRINRM